MLGKLFRATLLTSLIFSPRALPSQSLVSISVTAYPEPYSGPCPINIDFTGLIGTLGHKPGPLTYQWISSDGIQSPPETINFERGAVVTVHTVRKFHTSFSGWQQLVVLAPFQREYAVELAIQCLPGTKDHFRFAVLGDSQDVVTFENLIKILLRYSPDLVIFVGDIATDPELENWWKANTYLEVLTNLGIPVYNVVGNHEVGNTGPADKEGGFLDYVKRLKWVKLQEEYQLTFYNLPGNGPLGYERLAYSFEYGNALFVILDSFYIEPRTGTSYWSEISEVQLDWFSTTVAQSQKEHRFAFAHAPARSVTEKREDQPLVNWLLSNDFDAFFAGHEHLYARWKIGGQAYPVQIITGGGGGELAETNEVKRPPDYFELAHHFIVVEVDANRVSIQAIDNEGKAIEEYEFHKEHG